MVQTLQLRREHRPDEPVEGLHTIGETAGLYSSHYRATSVLRAQTFGQMAGVEIAQAPVSAG
ncbi:hypothetical protein LK07_20325 [Streptomyces pluripotens]|uniref:Uncharacterized protein n=1 Tax=Streptomyces pluripotens TaxID=1355015 RepID=A0A221P1P3_9ACTN|nr:MULTISPECIES: hypothetical protein [Streptomyces]ARP71715.1 hypothetical protein LK06_019165 [Streptomyces pluripotens]ASN25968.1 hypothetical protein LK07_20325 [Streptomyces pluripotens]KIE22782.1 hypothetical protein LK08_33425 [Streptomyces sp. MUSC 125]MCH0556209.1 hypothetical protein [Streptomyces sp. MUM 16J]